MDQPANHHQNPINLLHWFPYFDDQDHDPTLFRVDDMSNQIYFELHDDMNRVSPKQDQQNYLSELGLFQDFDPIDEYLSLWDVADDDLPLLTNYSYNDDIIHQCHASTSGGHEINIKIKSTTTTSNNRGGGGRRVRPLEFEEIAKHFELPMTMAARELRVGMTVLKKRCRELKIKRWPQRKLKSLKTLIQNVKELGLSEEIEKLEEQKRVIEKMPDVEFTQRTKKIRQACFKATFKKRRRLLLHAASPHYPC